MKQHTPELCDKRTQFIVSYDHAQSHRTSHMGDRLTVFSCDSQQTAIMDHNGLI
jgi:hypothetical protein